MRAAPGAEEFAQDLCKLGSGAANDDGGRYAFKPELCFETEDEVSVFYHQISVGDRLGIPSRRSHG